MNSTKFKLLTLQPKTATIILSGIVLFAAIIVFLWAAGVGAIKDIFAYLNFLQEQPPMWVEAPMIMSRFLLAPTVIFFFIAIVITKVSPQPRTWSRFLVISILLALTIRYLLWRSLSTLNLSSFLLKLRAITGYISVCCEQINCVFIYSITQKH
jgi:cellulose synthase (UDP-forming)